MKMASLLSCALVLSMSAASIALAQTPPATGAAPATSAAATTSDDAKKAKSKECSAEADAKGLKGKARKKFRSHCKHAK